MTSPEDLAGSGEDNGEAPEKKVPETLPSKTPLFQAINAARYHRQELIRAIEQRTSRLLICYVSGRAANIDRDDVLGLIDVLHNVKQDGDLDLLLHTGGGDIDAAEKIISLVRTVVGAGTLRVVVPDFAKSAGTLIALGGDKIVMSDSSELGPIDPQIMLNDGHGNLISHPVQSFLNAYKEHSEQLNANPNDTAARMMLSKLDPATLQLFKSAKDRARQFAEAQLLRKGVKDYTEVATKLLDTNRWLTHGQMIGWQAAEEMGLDIEYLEQKSEYWQLYWRLYCLQRLAVNDKQKLFESNYASLPFEG